MVGVEMTRSRLLAALAVCLVGGVVYSYGVIQSLKVHPGAAPVAQSAVVSAGDAPALAASFLAVRFTPAMTWRCTYTARANFYRCSTGEGGGHTATVHVWPGGQVETVSGSVG